MYNCILINCISLLEDIYHIIMQCPDKQHFRSAMFDELKVDPDINDVLMKDEQDTLYIYIYICVSARIRMSMS